MKVYVDFHVQTEIDKEDLHIFLGREWWLKHKSLTRIYVIDKDNKSLHRLIMGVDDPSIIIDHIDNNTLNNKRSNLRIASARLNAQNTLERKQGKYSSKYIGIYEYQKGKFRARTYKNKRAIHIGVFTCEVTAAKAYDTYMIANFTEEERGILNFPAKEA